MGYRGAGHGTRFDARIRPIDTVILTVLVARWPLAMHNRPVREELQRILGVNTHPKREPGAAFLPRWRVGLV